MTLDRLSRLTSLLDRAAVLAHAGATAAAGDLLRRALRLCPHHSRTLLALARLALTRGDAVSALGHLDALVQARPKMLRSPRVQHLRARALIAADRREEARQLLDELTAQYPGEIRFARLLLAVHLGGPADDRLGTSLATAHGLTPGDARLRRLHAQRTGGIHAAAGIELLESRAELSSMERLRLARLYRTVGRLRDARDQLDILLARHGDDAALFCEAGELAMDTGDLPAAIHRLTRAARLSVRLRRRAYGLLATAQMRCGRFVSAGRSWWRLAKLEGRNGAAWAGLITCGLVVGRRRLADRAHQCLSRFTSKAERRLLLATAWRDAATGAQNGSLVRQQTPHAHGSSHRALKMLTARSAAVFETQVALWPRRADHYFHLAVCLNASRERRLAEVSARQALEVNPNYAAARELSKRLARRLHRAA